jgi:hypothetical protein
MFLLALALVVSGCGSDSQDFVATGDAGVRPGADPNYFLGRVLLEGPVNGANVVIADLEGNVLHTLTSDGFGCFWGYAQLPTDFRITVSRAGDSMVYAREIRGGYDRRTMYVNPLTTLASLIMENEDLSLAESEQRIRRYFYMPEGYPFDWVENYSDSPFVPARFQELASQSGDLEQFYQQVASQAAADVQGRILVLESAESSLFANVTKTVVGDIFGDAVSVADSGIFGRVTQALGINIGTSDAINAVSEQLDQVLEDLDTLSANIASDSTASNYHLSLDSVQDSLDDLENRVKDIVDVALDVQGNIGLSTLIGNVTTLDIDDDVSLVLDYMLGQNSQSVLAFQYAQDLSLNQGYGLTSTETSGYLGVPLRQQSLGNQLQSQQAWLVGHLTAAAELYAETANMQIPVAAALRDADQKINSLAAAAQQARAQVPSSLPSNNIIDMTTGLQWCTWFQSQRDWYDANNFALAYQQGGYYGWRLATRDEMDDFVQNRVGLLVSDQDNDSDWLSAWDKMAADTTYYGDQTYVNTTPFVNDNTDYQGQSFFQYYYDSLNGGQNVYQWYGVNSNPATSLYSDDYLYNYQGAPPETIGSLSTFIICRDISNIKDAGDPFAMGQLSGTTLTVTASGNQLNAKGSLAVNGGTAISVDVTSRCYWESNNATAASVSAFPGNDLENGSIPNIPANPAGTYSGPGPIGQINWHPSLDGTPLPQVTFTANFWAPESGSGLGLSEATGTVVVSPPSGLVPVPTSAQVLPHNADQNLANVGQGGSVTLSYYVTTFYKDGQLFEPTLSDQSNPNEVEFQLISPSGQLIDSPAEGGGFIESEPNALQLFPSLPPGDYTVQVTYQTPVGGPNQQITGTTQLHIDNSGPAIATIDPTVGPTSGGGTMTITGSRFTGATSVTFGGVPATFFISTDQEITATIPAHAAGTVTVEVTGPGGSDTANYQYQ